MKKLSYGELHDMLCSGEANEGVIVFKQHPRWEKEYSEKERSYRVDNRTSRAFQPGKIASSIHGDCIAGTEYGVRLDVYMKADDPAERWIIDYCYIQEDQGRNI